MKIIWTVNIPLSAIKKKYAGLENNRGHWIQNMISDLNLPDKYELHIVHFNTKVNSYSYVKEGNVVFHVFKQRKWSFLDNYKLEINALIEFVNKINPEIIHIHGTENFYGLIAQDRGLASKIIISIQGIRYKIWQKYFIDFNEFSLLKYSIRSFTLQSFLLSYLSWRIGVKNENTILKFCNNYFTRTQFDRAAVLSKNALANILISDDHRKIRTVFEKNQWLLSESNKTRFVSIVSSSPFKGIFFLLDIVARVKMVFPDFHLSVVGKLEPPYLSKIGNLLKKLNIEGSVTLTGALDESRLLQVFKESRGFLFASYADNSSNSLQEALLFGMPSIAFFSGGNGTLIQNNKTGLLCPEGDSEYFSSLIVELIENDKKCNEFSTNARNEMIAKQKFPSSGRYVKIYENFVAKSI
ncbi:MAG: glycosyltransferase family 4 protein [Flavipsychrobacter sp.]|nr:glycosyltransferase family 4 protein [Flavipsychrobacter sp.]